MIATGITLTILIVMTILIGLWLGNKSTKRKRRRLQYIVLGVNFLLLVACIFWAGNLILPHMASAAETVRGDGSSSGLGFIAAGIAVGLSSIAAGIGVGIAGAAAMGAISEKPEILGRTLIIIGLAEGVAIYGLIIAIMILGRL